MYRAGHIAEIALYGLPGLGRWRLDAHALILTADADELLLYAYQPTLGAELFARGPLSSGLHTTGLVMHHPVTTGLVPARIELGQIINPDDPSSSVDDLVQRAHAELAAHWIVRGDGPLTADALPVLDHAIAAIEQRRDAVTAAEAARDRLVHRLLAGGLGPTSIARTGLSASRVSQISKSLRAGAA